MTTCNRCGKVVSNVEWDIHTCTPKPGLCDDCETVSHCLKHGCIPKHQVIKLAQEAEFHVVGQRVFSPVIDGSDMAWLLERFAALVRADEREACAKVADGFIGADVIVDIIRARGETHEDRR